MAYLFEVTMGTEEKEEGMGRSTLNKGEADTCLEVIKWIMKTAKGVTQNDIAVIAGYAAQVTHMEMILQQEGLKDVSTGTIDKWQGGEKKIVIISTVRTGMPPKTSSPEAALKFDPGSCPRT